MEHLWRIEKRDVWAFPNFDTRIYGIRIENTGLGFVEDEPESGCEPEEFVWADAVDLVEFNARSEAQWLELVEGWLADEQSDPAFSVRAWLMDSHTLDKEAVRTLRGNLHIFERCVQTTLLLNDEFMRAAQQQNETSLAGKFDRFGVIVRFNEAGVLDFSLWPQNKKQNTTFANVLQQIQFLLDWFSPVRDEAKIQRFTALRGRDENRGGHPHQIIVDYLPHPLSAHERAEQARELNDLLLAHFSPGETQALLELISPSR